MRLLSVANIYVIDLQTVKMLWPTEYCALDVWRDKTKDYRDYTVVVSVKEAEGVADVVVGGTKECTMCCNAPSFAVEYTSTAPGEHCECLVFDLFSSNIWSFFFCNISIDATEKWSHSACLAFSCRVCIGHSPVRTHAYYFRKYI